jgi:hypothetical protein
MFSHGDPPFTGFIEISVAKFEEILRNQKIFPIMQPRGAQPQINLVYGFDASAIPRLRITPHACKEMEPASFTRLPITATRAAIKETKRRYCRQLD